MKKLFFIIAILVPTFMMGQTTVDRAMSVYARNIINTNFTTSYANTALKAPIASPSFTGGISLTATVREYTTIVTLTATEIVGTAAGDVGHADGAILVAAPSSAYALEFVSAVLIYDYSTAAYTGGAGDDMVIRIGSTTVSPAIATTDLITATGDQVVHLRALSAADYDLPVGSTINLNATEITQPGTAAGVIRVHITYRVHTTGL